MNRIKRINITILDIIICIILGLIYAFFPMYYTNGYCKFSVFLLLKSLLLFIVFLVITSLFRYLINKVDKTNNKKLFIFKIFEKDNKLYKYRLIIIMGIILICWLPMLIYLYPGTVANDTWGQLGQLKGVYVLSDHHPIFDTIFMGNILFFFHYLFNDWHVAFFIYVLLQAIITSLVLAYSIIYAKEKLEIKNIFLIIFLLIYSLLPIFPGIVQNISKDSLFTWIYVLFFINYLEIIRTNGKVLDKKNNLIIVIIISILCCLTKKIGVYVLIISYISLLLIKDINKKKIIYIFSSLAVIMFICIPLLLKAYNVKPVGAQESYSLMFQQTARYVKYHKNDITKAEKKLIEEVIGKDLNKIANLYTPNHADPIKGYRQVTKTINYRKYIIVWFKQGLRHPNAYIDASNCMLSGWMSFRMYKPLMNMNNHSQLSLKVFKTDVSKRTWNKDMADTVEEIYSNIYKIPVIKYLLTPGLYISLIPLFSFTTIVRKRKKYVLGLIPLFILIFSCFVSPTSSNGEGQRYLYAIIYTSVLTLMWTIYIEKKK